MYHYMHTWNTYILDSSFGSSISSMTLQSKDGVDALSKAPDGQY